MNRKARALGRENAPRSVKCKVGQLVLLRDDASDKQSAQPPVEVKAAFELEPKLLRLDEILPLRTASDEIRASRQFKTLIASIKEVGIIEPLVVYPDKSGKFLLLDGNMRYAILADLEATDTLCLIATDDEAFTYNDKVNRLTPIQENRMIIRALESGVPEARIAAALDVNVSTIRQTQTLLNGICPEAIDLLKDRPISRGALHVLKKVRPLRQVEMAELMIALSNYSHTYANALLAATQVDQFIKQDKDKATEGIRPEDIARMEHEMDDLGKAFVVLEQSHGRNVLNLVLARGYLIKLLDNGRVVRYLATKYPEVLAEFQRIVESTSLEG